MLQIEHLYSSIFDQVFKQLYYKIVDCDKGTLIDGRPFSFAAKETIYHDPDAIFMLDWYCDGVIELTCGMNVVDRYDVNDLLLDQCKVMANIIVDDLEY